MSETEVLRFSHISIAYGGEVASRDISFTLSRGECLAIVGESGSGKTTLCKAILGLLFPDGRITAGDIDFKGQSLLKMSAKERRSLLGKEITTIFQDTKDAFCPIRTVGSQIHEAMEAHGRTSASSLREKAFSLMRKLGLEEASRIWDSYPSELSGGMMQRVGIVSALLPEPELILADEPTKCARCTRQAGSGQRAFAGEKGDQGIASLHHASDRGRQAARGSGDDSSSGTNRRAGKSGRPMAASERRLHEAAALCGMFLPSYLLISWENDISDAGTGSLSAFPLLCI